MKGSLLVLLGAGLSLSLPSAVAGAKQAQVVTQTHIDGYRGPIPFGNATINAPLDAFGRETYIGEKFFPETYIPDLCAASCTSTTRYNRDHPDPDGSYMACRFFVAYELYEDDVPEGLYCTMYTREYDDSYATNTGESRGNSTITLRDGYGWVWDEEYHRSYEATLTTTRTATITTDTTITVGEPTTLTLRGTTVILDRPTTVTVPRTSITVSQATTVTLPQTTVTIDKPTTITAVSTSVFDTTETISPFVFTICPTPVARTRRPTVVTSTSIQTVVETESSTGTIFPRATQPAMVEARQPVTMMRVARRAEAQGVPGQNVQPAPACADGGDSKEE